METLFWRISGILIGNGPENRKASFEEAHRRSAVGWSEGDHDQRQQEETNLADGDYGGFEGAGAFRFHLVVVLVVCY